ncbi:hypothetical protein DL763_005610 [Monosporascus cannonballus]|nr:hypothetical protein DL763_005610 [Monosporascus cannonballus]
MNAFFESNFFAYRDTIGYLLEQNYPASTWTSCTGAQGDIGTHPVPAMAQGALFSMATVACRENAVTNVRFNEVFLAFRIEVDEVAAQNGATSASDFASVVRGYPGKTRNPQFTRSGRRPWRPQGFGLEQPSHKTPPPAKSNFLSPQTLALGIAGSARRTAIRKRRQLDDFPGRNLRSPGV